MTAETKIDRVAGRLSADSIMIECGRCANQIRLPVTSGGGDEFLCPSCYAMIQVDAEALAHLENPHDETTARAKELDLLNTNMYSANVLFATSRVREAIHRGEKTTYAGNLLQLLREAESLLRAATLFMVHGRFDESVPIPEGDKS